MSVNRVFLYPQNLNFQKPVSQVYFKAQNRKKKDQPKKQKPVHEVGDDLEDEDVKFKYFRFQLSCTANVEDAISRCQCCECCQGYQEVQVSENFDQNCGYL